MLKEMERRPVLVNRYPVLHRYGLMAFMPKLVKGDTIQLSPITTKPFGADFDGDQVYSHIFIKISDENLSLSDRFNNCKVTHQILENSMTVSNTPTFPVLNQDNIHMIHLEDFPHGELCNTTQGQFGKIEWYDVPKGVQVLSMVPDGSMQWCDVKYWTVHKNCKVQTVTLASGHQIFTDNDPRAVFGIAAQTLNLDTFTPSDAVKKKVLVPRVVRANKLFDAIADMKEFKYTSALRNKGYNNIKDTIPLTEDFGYLIGMAAGDGWATSDLSQFCIASVSENIISKVDKIIPSLFISDSPKRYSVDNTRSWGESKSHRWASKDLNNLIGSLVNRKAVNKHLPPWFFKANLDFRKGLFAGLMDSDGSISISKGKTKPQLMANLTTISLRLAQEVVWLASSIGIKSRITATKSSTSGTAAWIVNFSNIDIKNWNGYGMVHKEKLEKLNSIQVGMSPALAKTDIVPISKSLAEVIVKEIYKSNGNKSSTFYGTISVAKNTGYLTRFSADQILSSVSLNVLFNHPDFKQWLSIVEDTSVTWDLVESFEDTDIAITGYDLTVPGAETFTDIHGVVLHNTMQYHVPVTEKARQDAIDKMLPSKNLYSAASFKALYVPNQEFVQGLHAASTVKDEEAPKRTFATRADAIRAYKRGEINLGTQVEILS
jgi:hypothetical protein